MHITTRQLELIAAEALDAADARLLSCAQDALRDGNLYGAIAEISAYLDARRDSLLAAVATYYRLERNQARNTAKRHALWEMNDASEIGPRCGVLTAVDGIWRKL